MCDSQVLPQASKPGKTARADSDIDLWRGLEIYSLALRHCRSSGSSIPTRKSTPEGHLIGSIGEVIATQMFKPNPYQEQDVTTGTGKSLQIEFMQNGISRFKTLILFFGAWTFGVQVDFTIKKGAGK